MHDYMTRHAKTRREERSIREEDIDLFQDWADIETQRRDGAVALTLSQQVAMHLQRGGTLPSQIERLRRLVLVIKDGRVLTLYRRPPCSRRARTDQHRVKRRDARGQSRAKLTQWGRT